MKGEEGVFSHVAAVSVKPTDEADRSRFNNSHIDPEMQAIGRNEVSNGNDRTMPGQASQQPWRFNETEKAFFQLQENISDSDDLASANEPGVILAQIIELSATIGIPQYANYCLAGLESDGRFDKLIASHVGAPEYVTWKKDGSATSKWTRSMIDTKRSN